MCSLVLVHEVHIDGVIGKLLVVLRRKVAHGLLQHLQPLDPHFCGREGMAPGDDTDAVVVCVDLLDRSNDFIRALARRQIFDGDRHSFVDVVRHLLGVLCNMRKHVIAIQRLRAGQPVYNFLFHNTLPHSFFNLISIFSPKPSEYGTQGSPRNWV